MKKTLLALTTVALLGTATGAHAAGDDKPKTVCGFLQEMSESIKRMETNITGRLDQMDARLTGLETKVTEVKRDVDQVRATLGSFGEQKDLGCQYQSQSDLSIPPQSPEVARSSPEKYVLSDLTGDKCDPKEDMEYVVMLNTRLIRAAVDRSVTLHKGEIKKVTPMLREHLVSEGHAKYVGKISVVLMEIIKDCGSFPPMRTACATVPVPGTKYKKGQRIEMSYEEASPLSQRGEAVIVWDSLS